MTAPEVRHASPLYRLARQLGVPGTPAPRWWVIKLAMWLSLLGPLTAIGWLLNGTAQAFIFTFVSAIAGVQLAGPYRRLTEAAQWHLEVAEGSSSVGQGVAFALTRCNPLERVWYTYSFNRDADGVIGGSSRYREYLMPNHPDRGMRRVAYPWHRLKYRRLYRAWHRYAYVMNMLILGQETALLKAPPDGRLRQRFWCWRIERLLTVTGLELVRTREDPDDDLCVETLVNHWNARYPIELRYQRQATRRMQRRRRRHSDLVASIRQESGMS